MESENGKAVYDYEGVCFLKIVWWCQVFMKVCCDDLMSLWRRLSAPSRAGPAAKSTGLYEGLVVRYRAKKYGINFLLSRLWSATFAIFYFSVITLSPEK